MSYFDFILYAVRDADRAAFEAFARQTNAIFREFGALRVVDSWGEDVPRGKLTDLYRAVAAEDGEAVCIGFVEWPDKAARDAGWGKFESDPRMGELAPPFDGKRMIFGGFAPVVDA